MHMSGRMGDLESGVNIDFKKLSPNISSEISQDMSLFMELLASPYKSLLMHPLCEAFLDLKWTQVKNVHLLAVLATHFVYSVFYTIYCLLVFGSICKLSDNSTVAPSLSPFRDTQNSNFSMFMSVPCHQKCNTSACYEEGEEYVWHLQFVVAKIAWLCLVIFSIFYICNESLRLYKAPKHYFLKLDSYVDIILIVSFPMISFHCNPFYPEQLSLQLWQWHMAAIGCLLTWIQMMFLVGKLPRMGKYIQMFR